MCIYKRVSSSKFHITMATQFGRFTNCNVVKGIRVMVTANVKSVS